ncbi:hypothetical protein FVER53590_01695 [Fusarium verticillioides]|nr:hypothetical protein FVER53590_01695 [Fusarium verticillioides]
MEPAFSKAYGFTDTKCWWAATATTERLRKPKNWLYMLYLASNFSSTDPRDMIYGLHGLMSITRGSELLYPDYGKTTVEVYMDSVAAAFVDMQNTDVLLYAPGTDHPTWVPRWDRAMLFRNPSRFGEALPWRPSLDSRATWSINAESRVLALRGVLFDSIKVSETYNESLFSNANMKMEEGRIKLGHVWHKILDNLRWGRAPKGSWLVCHPLPAHPLTPTWKSQLKRAVDCLSNLGATDSTDSMALRARDILKRQLDQSELFLSLFETPTDPMADSGLQSSAVGIWELTTQDQAATSDRAAAQDRNTIFLGARAMPFPLYAKSSSDAELLDATVRNMPQESSDSTRPYSEWDAWMPG